MEYEKNLFNLCLQLHHAAEGDQIYRSTAKTDIELWGIPGDREISVYHQKRYHFKVSAKEGYYHLFDEYEGFTQGNYARLIADELREMGYPIPEEPDRAWKFNSSLKPNQVA
jgi:hypothetical protein